MRNIFVLFLTMLAILVASVSSVFAQYSDINGKNNSYRLESGLEMARTFSYYNEHYSFDSSFTKALKPIYLFPETGFSFLKTDGLLKDLTEYKNREIRKTFCLQLRHQSEFESTILRLAFKLNGQSDLSKLKTKEALMLLTQVIRFQLSSKGSVNNLIAEEIDPAIKILKTREHFRLNVFNLISVDEYFLAGYRKLDYYCGMVSWAGVYAFDVFKKHIPSLANVYLFECGLQGPSHSFNLILTRDEKGIGMYLIDFQKEKFWNHDLVIPKSSDKLLIQLDLSEDVEITRLGK